MLTILNNIFDSSFAAEKFSCTQKPARVVQIYWKKGTVAGECNNVST